jgi:hypothetical protein
MIYFALFQDLICDARKIAPTSKQKEENFKKNQGNRTF